MWWCLGTCELNDEDEVLSGDVFPGLFTLLVQMVSLLLLLSWRLGWLLRDENGREDEVKRGCIARPLVSKDDESSGACSISTTVSVCESTLTMGSSSRINTARQSPACAVKIIPRVMITSTTQVPGRPMFLPGDKIDPVLVADCMLRCNWSASCTILSSHLEKAVSMISAMLRKNNER